MAITNKLTAIANAIREKTGESGTMTLAQMPDKIASISGGGDQPTLYPATVVGGYNQLSWTKNTQNGAFGVVKAKVEYGGTTGDVTVTSPLTITENEDGKYLEIETYSDNFISSVDRILLYHMTAQNSLLSIANGASSANYYIAVELPDTTHLYPEGSISHSGDIYLSPAVATVGGIGSGQIAFSLRALTATKPSKLKLGICETNASTLPNGSTSVTVLVNNQSVLVDTLTGGMMESILDKITYSQGDAITFIINFTKISVKYLGFSARQANSTVALTSVGTFSTDWTIYYSTTGTSWNAYTIGSTITLSNIGDKVYFYGETTNKNITCSGSKYHQFVMSGKIDSFGKVTGLINQADDTIGQYQFVRLFKDCTSLVSAPILPSTTLTLYCYNGMFMNCSSLIEMPELNSTAIEQFCYGGMFQGCSSLSIVQNILPATTLKISCYGFMFYLCSSIEKAPELPATTLVSGCYERMFSDCENLKEITVGFTSGWTATNNITRKWVENVNSTGTFRCKTALGTNTTIQRGDMYCPTGWTVVNTD